LKQKIWTSEDLTKSDVKALLQIEEKGSLDKNYENFDER